MTQNDERMHLGKQGVKYVGETNETSHCPVCSYIGSYTDAHICSYIGSFIRLGLCIGSVIGSYIGLNVGSYIVSIGSYICSCIGSFVGSYNGLNIGSYTGSHIVYTLVHIFVHTSFHTLVSS